MRVQQILPRPKKNYPWNYRIDFGDTKLGKIWMEIQPWSKQMEVPGVWTGSVFYTNQQGATMCVLRWS